MRWGPMIIVALSWNRGSGGLIGLGGGGGVLGLGGSTTSGSGGGVTTLGGGGVTTLGLGGSGGGFSTHRWAKDFAIATKGESLSWPPVADSSDAPPGC